MHVHRVHRTSHRYCCIDRRLRTAAVVIPLILLLLSVTSIAQVVRVGFYENAPKLYTDDSGRIVGFFPEIIEYISGQEGWDLEYVSGTWTECLSRLETGEIDLMPDVGYSVKRAAIYGFADEPLFINWGIIYAVPDSGIESIPDLVGKRIAVMTGSIHTEGEQGIKAMLSQFDIRSTYVEVPDYTAVLEAIHSGAVDAGAVNRLFGLAVAKQYDVRQTPIVFNPRELRFAYPMDSEFGEQLAERIDLHVGEMKADPESVYYRSIETYLLGAAPDFTQRLPHWLAWLLGGGVALIIASVLVILLLRRRQRRLSTRLEESEIQFETMFEKAAVGIIIIKPGEGRFLRANPRFCEMMGYTELELQRIHVDEIFHPEDPGRHAPAVRDVVEGRSERLVSEERLVHKDGAILWCAITRSMVRDPSGKIAYGIGVIQDVTERKRAEDAVQTERDRAQLYLDIAGVIIVALNADETVQMINERGCETLGLPEQDIVGANWFDQFVPEQHRERTRQTFRSLMSGDVGSSEYFENLIVDSAGIARVVAWNNVVLRDDDGTIVGTLGSGKDVTEQRQAQAAQRESEARLRNIIEQSIDGIALVDSDGLLVEWNKGQSAITGIPADNALGRPFWEVQCETVPEEKREPHLMDLLREATQTMLQSGDSPWAGRFLEQEIQRPDGSLRMIQIGSFPIELGERRMLGSVTRDITDQKRAERELEEHREDLERLVVERTEALNSAIEAAKAAMFQLDLVTNEVKRDERWFEIAGITKEEFDGTHETWRQLVHPDDLPGAEASIADAVASGKDAVRHEYRIVRPDSGIRYIETRAKIVRDDTGKATKLVGMNIDITDRRQAEEALRESDAFLRSIIEHMPIDFFAIDKDMRYTMQSPTSKAAVGDVIGKRADELDVDAPLQEEWMSELHDVLSGGSSQREYDVPVETGGIATYISNMAPVRVSGKIVAAIGTSIDITDRKRSEERIRQLSRVVEESPVSVVITNVEGTIEYVNPRFTEVTGYKFAEAIGENPRVLKSGHQPEEYYAELWQTITAGGNWRGEFCNVKKSGDLFWELASISPIRDENGVITHFVAIKEDITERKHAAWDLEQTKRDAESANQAKSEFLANMSHELRTPLNAVIGFSEVLEDGTFGDLNDKQTQYVGNILQSGRHLLSLINDILDLSKVEAGKMELYLSDVDASRVMLESLTFVQEKAHQHGIRLETNLPEDVRALTIQADERKLKQILFNLLSNATKFTPDDGSVTLSAEVAENNLLVQVQDTGIGLKPEDLHRVFDEFEQIDSSYAKTQQGTGLGLALTKRLIELHGGRIWAQSDGEGNGSTFTFTLPLTAAGESEGS
jgi:PAS domain S-box-containing protein